MGEVLLVRVSKITDNGKCPLIYLPKKAVKALGLKKGVEVKILIDTENGLLMIQRLQPLKRVSSKT